MTTLTHLECLLCGARQSPESRPAPCPCGGRLAARYDLAAARESWNRDWIQNGPPTMWRYAPVLPVARPHWIVSLGEGLTPLVRTERLGSRRGWAELWIKDEGANPGGGAAAREFSCALSVCGEWGAAGLRAAPAVEEAVALAAYAAHAGVPLLLRMPDPVPAAVAAACRALGAKFEETAPPAEGWLDAGTELEPYRLEGVKTAGFELAEQLRWSLPEAIVCPGASGALAEGIWKAVLELETLGWVAARRPKVFAAGCGDGPQAALRAVEESGGAAVEVTPGDARRAALEAAKEEGILVSPGGGMALAAAFRLAAEGGFKAGDRVVVVNPASGLLFSEYFGGARPVGGEADKLGGLITPR